MIWSQHRPSSQILQSLLHKMDKKRYSYKEKKWLLLRTTNYELKEAQQSQQQVTATSRNETELNTTPNEEISTEDGRRY